MTRVRRLAVPFLVACALASTLCAQQNKTVLVVTAHAEDYLIGAGGTLAKLIGEGYTAHVVQVTNDEKNSDGLEPAETRKANIAEGDRAAKLLGVQEIVRLGHKSGELGYISSTELREEMFAMIRYFKPRILFIPDPYIHYDENRDHFYAGKMAEEAWGYSGGGTFSHELNRMGFPGYGAPEVYFYAVRRPYRPGEGGEGNARFRPVDISATFDRKVQAILALKTGNRLFAAQSAQQLARLGRPVALDASGVDKLTRTYLEELAETIGKKHGFRYGEEFNYFGPKAGLPEHVIEHAVPAR